jgi:hypothetical protein
MEQARPKPLKAADPAALATEDMVKAADAACITAGRPPAKTDKCVRRIRPHLPKEYQDETFETLKEALGKAKANRKMRCSL